MTKLTSNQLDQLAQATVEKVEALVDCWDRKKPGKEIEIGQVVFTPVCDTETHHKVADVVRANSRSHDAAEFHVRRINEAIDFRQKPGRLPLAALRLGETEEIILNKGKQRPCVVIAKSGGVATASLPEGEQRNKGQHAFKPIYCVAPLFSCSTGDKTTSFGPVMAARIKCMMYPQFLYAPKSEPAITCDSVVRLDRIFWTHLQCATNPQQLLMSGQMLAIAWDQLRVLTGAKPSDDYLELRELLLGELPRNARNHTGTRPVLVEPLTVPPQIS